MSRHPALHALAGLLLLVTMACSGDPATDADGSADPTPSAPATTSAPVAPQPDPRPGTCRTLTFTQATKSVDSRKPVRCRTPHSAVTFAVGQLELLVDGHLLAVDSDRVTAELGDRCQRRLGDWLGGSVEDLRLSRFRAVWFRPSLEEASRGASWYRCDLVALAREDRLARFRGTLEGVLDSDDALSQWGICGTSSPASKAFRKVICSERHSWRAVSVVELPRRSAYLGRKAAKTADATCRDLATAEDNPSLEYEWAFQWPARKDWQAGQRYGWCWLPA